MPLILAVEPDRHQASQLSAIVRGRLHAELVIEATAERALAALGDRVPDLILTAALLSSRDEAALAGRLRELESAAAHIQTITIPVLAAPRSRPRIGGMLSALRRDKSATSEVDGCDPAVFADQCATYLEQAISGRNELAAITAAQSSSADDPTVPAEEATAAAPVPDDGFEAFDLPLTVEHAAGEAIDEPMLVEQGRDHVVGESAPGGEDPIVEPLSGEPARDAEEDAGAIEEELHTSGSADQPTGETAIEDAVIEQRLDATGLEQEAVADPAGADFSDATGATESDMPVLSADHLLDESPLFELVTAAGAEDEPRADLDGEDDNYIELDLSEFLDEAGRSVEAAPGVSAAIETEAAETAAPVCEEPAGVEAPAEAIDTAAPVPAEGEEDDWLEVVAALRRDVQRLDAAPAAARAPKPLKKLPRKPLKGKPVQDEWGFFDPEQCGFAALLAKLDEVTATDDPGRRRKRA
jgi:CheY-like chemotaxis protein